MKQLGLGRLRIFGRPQWIGGGFQLGGQGREEGEILTPDDRDQRSELLDGEVEVDGDVRTRRRLRHLESMPQLPQPALCNCAHGLANRHQTDQMDDEE